MKKNVGLLAANRHVGCRALGDGVWRRSDILGFLVLAEFLIRIGFDTLGPSVVVIGIPVSQPASTYRFLSEIGIRNRHLNQSH